MNNVQSGYLRDRRILDAIGEWRAVTAQQVVLVFGMHRRKAQQRLRILWRRGALSRTRIEEGLAYHVRRPGNLEHLIAVNWARTWFLRHLRSWETLRWDYEVDLGLLQTDALCAVRNTITKDLRCWFVEVENGTWHKTPAYCTLYETDAYLGQWWCAEAKRFPTIFVVGRCQEKDNRANLRLEVHTLEELRCA